MCVFCAFHGKKVHCLRWNVFLCFICLRRLTPTSNWRKPLGNKICYRGVMDIILCTSHRGNMCTDFNETFFVVLYVLGTVIRLLEIKFQQLKICFGVVLYVVLFDNRQKIDALVDKKVFLCFMHLWKDYKLLLSVIRLT